MSLTYNSLTLTTCIIRRHWYRIILLPKKRLLFVCLGYCPKKLLHNTSSYHPVWGKCKKIVRRVASSTVPSLPFPPISIPPPPLARRPDHRLLQTINKIISPRHLRIILQCAEDNCRKLATAYISSIPRRN